MSRHMMLLLGVALIGFECWGVWEYMQFKGAPLYLACLGIAVAVGAPCLALIRGPMQWAAAIIAPIAMVAILTTAMARMGSVADVALQAQAKAKRQNALAEAAVRDFVSTLDEAREAVRLACANAVTKKCTDAQTARNTAQESLNRARQAVVDVPLVAGDPAAQAISDALGGFISPERAAILIAIGIPVMGSVMAWLFFASWRTWPHASRAVAAEPTEPALVVRTVDIAPHAATDALPPPSGNSVPVEIAKLRERVEKARPVLVASSPGPCRVADVLKRLKVGGRSRLELATVQQLYRAECKQRGCDPVGSDAFADEVAEWSASNNVVLEPSGGRVYLVGVRLIA